MLEKYIKKFLAGHIAERWIVIPGLRGVGKTTLMSQIYNWIYKNYVQNKVKRDELNIIYISLDVLNRLNCDLMHFLRIYESILGCYLEKASQPVFFFIDEVQVDNNWAKVLKTVYDRTSNVFMICTGSSATYLQMDADTAGRRAIIEHIYPLNFSEYQMIAHNKPLNEEIKKEIYKICYWSDSAPTVYQKLKSIESEIDRIWKQYDDNQIEDYLRIGSMPLVFQVEESNIYKTLVGNIDKTISEDLITDKRFNFNKVSTDTIKQLVSLLANNPTTPSLKTLGDTLTTSNSNLLAMLQALIKAEVLIRIPAYSHHYTAVRLPVHYQFSSAAVRYAHWDITGNENIAQSRRGQLMEDIAALHYYREFIHNKSQGFLTYVYAKKDIGYCDYILKIANNHQIALEFDLGQKTPQQVQRTMNKINCNYGLVFSNSLLKIDETKKVVIVPLRFFLLM